VTFWAYMLHCRGGVFYTGHADDLDQRVAQHKSGLIPGFTRNLRPVELVWCQEFQTRDDAFRAEFKIKGWSKKRKLALIRGDWGQISRLAKSKNGASTSSARAVLEVSETVLAAMTTQAAVAHPLEACGILFGSAQGIAHALPCANVHPDPARRFEIDPAALIAAHKAARAGGPAVAGYYHSHPSGRAEPSTTDCTCAAADGMVWAIVAGRAVGFWRDSPGGFEPLSYKIVPG
jgi:predicted GIY-YIG superfamily endonuclease/proteasome lid subunit RPN8/RPN11